ncbi:MAG: exopolyphosphatase [Melioribacteraceae bacterium]|nr:MAG: exopolyphosphatase [Melioribacteraceae bacterium]
MATGNIAAIDIGTNSFHLIVVKADNDGNFDIIDREKEVIRLGDGNPGDIKAILPHSIERAVIALKRFKGIADSHNAGIRAVATSAVREALNGEDFIEKVYHETGIEIEVVSGHEEARLIYLGILKAVPVYDERALCFDIGGGSTEFVVGYQGNILFSTSLKLGAVRLTHKFFPDYKVNKSLIKVCRNWVEGELFHVLRDTKNYSYNKVVGSSGTFLSAASMIAARKGQELSAAIALNNYSFTSDDLFELEEEILSKKTPAQRKKIPGLDGKRIDIIPAGIIILATIVRLLEIKTLTASDYALREGVIIDSIQSVKQSPELPSIVDIRMESVKKLADSSSFPREHCAHVATLAGKIFDQTQNYHKLEPKFKEYLEVAARLHDIGHHIAHSQHHRHTQYIIKNSELLGFTDNEINIIANVARYHRKSHPKNSHQDFAVLSEQNREIVRKLSALLRLADSLDRTHQRIVSDIEVKDDKKIVNFNLHCNGKDPAIELWNLDRRKLLFEETFGKTINVNII